MPRKISTQNPRPKTMLQVLGQKVKDARKFQGVSAVATAEAAGISRVTLHRIERGEPSVTMGAYLNVISSLGLSLELIDPSHPPSAKSSLKTDLPEKIRVGEFKQLKRLAWQLKSDQTLSPEEVLDLYERNWRHIDLKDMDSKEREFLRRLLKSFGKERMLV